MTIKSELVTRRGTMGEPHDGRTAGVERDSPIAIAFPLHTVDRQQLRDLVGHPLPAIYPDSTAAPCTRCGLTLAVGPLVRARLEAGTAVLMCPVCAVTIVGPDPPMENLGNPDSHFEEEH